MKQKVDFAKAMYYIIKREHPIKTEDLDFTQQIYFLSIFNKSRPNFDFFHSKDLFVLLNTMQLLKYLYGLHKYFYNIKI